MSLDAGGVPASLILCVVSPLAQADEQGGQVVLSASLTPEGEELSMLRLADSSRITAGVSGWTLARPRFSQPSSLRSFRTIGKSYRDL